MYAGWYAISLSTIAGLSTVIGAFLGIFNKKPSQRFISFMMSMSAGVMVFLSFTEMFVLAVESLDMAMALVLLGIGLLVAFLIDTLLPDAENVHDHLYDKDQDYNPQMMVRRTISVEEIDVDPNSNGAIFQTSVQELERSNPIVKSYHDRGLRHGKHGNPGPYGREGMRRRGRGKRQQEHCEQLFCIDKEQFMKLGLLSAMALFIHNVPEGLATFSAALINPTLGIEISLATALHNIPEGICVAIPVYLATNSKKKGLIYATVSGLAEPAGALLAWLILYQFLNDAILHGLLAFVAGIMVYISVDTLIPTAKTMEHKHTMIAGFTLGMMLMGISLIFLA
ncbi:MAG: ZIP family metal transporter [Candidatus Hodarchaeota archaeon]